MAFSQYVLLVDATTDTTGSPVVFRGNPRTVQGILTSTVGTTVSATVDIEASNDGNTYFTIGTISLSGAGSDSKGLVLPDAYLYVRAKASAITAASGCKVSVYGSA